jgi:hypothetical protein
MWFRLLILPILIGGFFRGYFVGSQEKWLCRWGRPCGGRIVRKWKVEGEPPRSFQLQSEPSQRTTYHLQYEFLHPLLGVQTEILEMDEGRWDRLREGQALTVLIDSYASGKKVIYELSSFECR